MRTALPAALMLLIAFGCAQRARRGEGSGADLGEGLASYYGIRHHGKTTANGEKFDRFALTAAHRTVKFGTCLRVVNLENRRDVEVRVNDRGPYSGGRIIDVSEGAAQKLGMIERGVVRVRLYKC